MTKDEFRKYGKELVDWIADYYENIESYSVKSQVAPGEIISRLPEAPPEQAESFDDIISDFDEKIIPGITHWQHPNFHAYFPANGSFESICAEMLTAALGAQCMSWETSPAAAELEERMMEWLGQLIGLPQEFAGVIQDTASTATLCSILTAREKASGYAINEEGTWQDEYRVYCSYEAHSSVEKAVKVAGIGRKNCVKIALDDEFAMIPSEMEAAVREDLAAGRKPLCVVAALGTTGSTAVDPLKEIGEICAKHGLWLHVDAALAGTALLLPEFRHLLDGIEYVDSFVFNPHKWMFTNFDCSAYFVRAKGSLIRTFEILPEYLKTGVDTKVNNYRDWGIQLGRRFRALKLWFVMRGFGVEGLRARVRRHIELTAIIKKRIAAHPHMQLMAPAPFNTICFRYTPKGMNERQTDEYNAAALQKLNATGKTYMTHTKLNGRYVIRIVIGQTYLEQRHVERLWEMVEGVG